MEIKIGIRFAYRMGWFTYIVFFEESLQFVVIVDAPIDFLQSHTAEL